MLTRKSIARTAAATAGLALVATGALAPAGAAERQDADHREDGAAVAEAQGDNGTENSQAEDDRGTEQRSSSTRGRSADAPYGNAYGRPADGEADDTRADGRADEGANGLGEERGNGHTPVTVCHATGNGGFVEITFDENALEKHRENHMKHMDDHQDFVVEEGAGCDEIAPVTTEDEVLTEDTDTTATDIVVTETPLRETVDAEVLGVEAFAARAGAGSEAPAVLGAEAAVAGSAAAPATGPMAGILPQTGAAPMALATAAGLGLVGAGATLVARRRRAI